MTPEGRVTRTIRNVVSFSIKGLATGVYFLRMTDQDGRLLKMEKRIRKD